MRIILYNNVSGIKISFCLCEIIICLLLIFEFANLPDISTAQISGNVNLIHKSTYMILKHMANALNARKSYIITFPYSGISYIFYHIYQICTATSEELKSRFEFLNLNMTQIAKLN